MAAASLTAVEADAGHQDRASLLDVLLREGVLYASADQPVVSGTGRPAPWMLDSLGATLGPAGSELAARCLLRVIDDFESCQLATYGVTGIPLLMGCIHGGRGRYRGIVVRKAPRPHGSMKQIEGHFDRSEPVVIIDDSICSGFSMRSCADRLEEAGLQVEGAVSLVRFSYDPGVVSMLDRGYRMATVFDLYQDLIDRIDGESPYVANPTKERFSLPVSTPAPEGLHPAALARLVMAEVLARGNLLAAPAALDRDYDAAGGCFVSLRRHADIHDRPARSGFWHFPGEPAGTAAGDLARAAVQTARQLQKAAGDPRQMLEECGVAVTFFSALEECTVGALDNDCFGIVIRSTDRPHRMGGALPRMPGIADERQQLAHAWRNARLHPLESHCLYRHRVDKLVEPGAAWHGSGIPGPAPGNPPEVGRLARLARQLVLSALGEPPSDGPDLTEWPPAASTVLVTVYAGGRLIGCCGGPLGADHAALESYAAAALGDDRFPAARQGDAVAVSVSMLSNRQEIGVADPAWVTRFAHQALEVRQGARRALLLPSVAMTNNLTPQGFVAEVIDKAGITRAPYEWARYDVITALAGADGARLMEHGLPCGAPAPSAAAQLERLHGLLLGYARRHHVAEGAPVGRYEPFADRLRTGISGARLAYGAWVKARAGMVSEAQDDLRRLERSLGEDGWIRFDDEPPSISELAFVLLAHIQLGIDGPLAAGLASKLWSQIDGHGRFATHAEHRAGTDNYQDYAPGQALLALAHARDAGATDGDISRQERALRYYRMRFRQNHHWGAVAWLTQAFTAWDQPGEAYRIVDWALGFQSEKSGGFLNDHQADSPGATTALYLEAVAAARSAAERDGDDGREARYRQAAARSLGFLDRLVYQERDRAVLPNPGWALGGLRTSLAASDVRIDYVHHGLAAMLALAPAWGSK